MVTSQAITHVAHGQAILYSRIAMSAIDIYDDAKVEWSDWGLLARLSGPSRTNAPDRHKHIGPDQTHRVAERCHLQFSRGRGANNGIQNGDVQADPSGEPPAV
jgi:hypothetical protein